MNKKRVIALAISLIVTVGCFAEKSKGSINDQALSSMKRATQFMMDNVSNNGGFVWSYLPDMSRRWGEMEAKPSMVWVQPPGTPSVGHLLLDAYHATGDEYYYQSAEKVANILIWGQLPCGGWGYMFDLGGDASIRDWYATIGANAWRLEEFQHYYGNATFDDSGTAEASKFLLRMYVEKYDPKYKPALDKCIDFVLESQYPNGGWPQRYPLRNEFSKKGLPDYSSFITLNDAVAGENIDFLMKCHQSLGEQRIIEPVLRAMYLIPSLQLGQPQPGWADQYTVKLEPMGARSYEPKAVNSSGTAAVIRQLIDYYSLTGDSRFLRGIPEAIDWLETLELPKSEVDRSGKPLREGTIMAPRFIEVGTGKPLYVHRTGSNIVNGYYYTDQDISNTIGHYSSQGFINIPELRQIYAKALTWNIDELKKKSPLFAKELVPLPRYFTYIKNSEKADGPHTSRIISELNAKGYWPAPIMISNPYIGPGSKEATPGNYVNTNVGDKYDTSPYWPETEVIGISMKRYIENMQSLISFVEHPEK